MLKSPHFDGFSFFSVAFPYSFFLLQIEMIFDLITSPPTIPFFSSSYGT